MRKHIGIKILAMSAAVLVVMGSGSLSVTASVEYAQLEEANGEASSVASAEMETGSKWTVKVDTGYLALRSKKAYDSKNELGELYTGDKVEVIDSEDEEYWYVYSEDLDNYGYVNKDYLVYHGGYVKAYSWSVKVDEGYLALRKEKAYDSKNEIGELYTGDVVKVKKISSGDYWYVYAPRLDEFGYVNKDYLRFHSGSNSFTKKVKVNDGYLALRSGKAYDSANEIGELYTGDEVEVINSDGKEYWLVYSKILEKVGYVNKDYLR